jgi:hypothetical protein
MKPLIYIAAPYTHPDPVANTHDAVRTGLYLRDRYDIAVIIPHLSLIAHLVDPRPDMYWYAYDLDILANCDGLIRLDGDSQGADREVAYADEHGIPVLDLRNEIRPGLREWIDLLPSYDEVHS